MLHLGSINDKGRFPKQHHQILMIFHCSIIHFSVHNCKRFLYIGRLVITYGDEQAFPSFTAHLRHGHRKQKWEVRKMFGCLNKKYENFYFIRQHLLAHGTSKGVVPQHVSSSRNFCNVPDYFDGMVMICSNLVYCQFYSNPADISQNPSGLYWCSRSAPIVVGYHVQK